MRDASKTWSAVMAAVFAELYRVSRKNGIVAFEVGEVRNGKRQRGACGSAGPRGRLHAAGGDVLHEQQFTKTANIGASLTPSRH